MMNSRGFTLLEIIIAISILAFVSLFTAQSIQRALANRTKVQGEIERVSGVRDALKVMESDINRAFNHTDINIQLYNETAKERNKKIEEAKNKGGAGNITTTPGAVTTGTPASDPYAGMEPLKLKEEKKVTHFMGERESLNLSTLSNARISSEERTSDQAEVGYSVMDCKSRADRSRGTKCLVRRVATVIDADILTGGEETNLVEDVTKLEFRYLGPNDPTQWVDSWYTNDRGDDKTRGIFPYAVEVTLEVHNTSDPLAKPVRMTMVAAIRNPNNPAKKAVDPNLPPGTPGAPGGGPGN